MIRIGKCLLSRDFYMLHNRNNIFYLFSCIFLSKQTHVLTRDPKALYVLVRVVNYLFCRSSLHSNHSETGVLLAKTDPSTFPALITYGCSIKIKKFFVIPKLCIKLMRPVLLEEILHRTLAFLNVSLGDSFFPGGGIFTIYKERRDLCKALQ